ncbi:MFS transporter, partial [Acinetobacter baumannii]|uniref:MFS transporter n=1 Tax=Acinetobacter baumannii TaxID=470 RepID=UPI001C55F9B3
RRDPLSFAEWRSLFKNKTMWGMMLGFSGINYTAWLYLAWLPGYLQTAYNLDLKSTGFMAAIPFLFGAAGMLINGYVTDWLVKGGMAPISVNAAEQNTPAMMQILRLLIGAMPPLTSQSVT